MQFLNRREFSGLCAALGSLTTFGTASGAASAAEGRTVKFRDGAVVPALGQGSANRGKGRRPQAEEEEALRTGLSLGMTLVDTAEIYGSEEFIGRAISGQRDRVFLVSKVWPNHVAGDGITRACEASLKRLGTDHLDLYLLHWPNGVTNVAHVVTMFEKLRSAGKIRAWGVSNFSVRDMENLFRVPQGDRCATNQLPYSIGGPGANLLRDPTLGRIGAAHGCSAAAVALAWAIRTGNVIAIPESGSASHVKENAVAFSLTLTPDDLRVLDTAYPPPNR